LEGMKRLGVSASEAVYIGDMDVDVQTGKAAEVPIWLVPGGAVGLEAALAACPDKVLTGFAQLLDLLPGVSR
jgi:phosphoglycolate phosphatase-like HAD superfamily hydrolase